MFILECKQHEGRDYMSYFCIPPIVIPYKCLVQFGRHNSYLQGLHWVRHSAGTLLILFIFTTRLRYVDTVKYSHLTDRDGIGALPRSVMSVPES